MLVGVGARLTLGAQGESAPEFEQKKIGDEEDEGLAIFQKRRVAVYELPEVGPFEHAVQQAEAGQKPQRPGQLEIAFIVVADKDGQRQRQKSSAVYQEDHVHAIGERRGKRLHSIPSTS